MTTLASAIQDAPRLCQQQRFGLRGLLRVDGAASPEDLALADRGRTATSPDQFDAWLAEKKVCALFCRGVLSFGPG